MSPELVIKNARDAIGEQPANDFSLKPTSRPEQVEQQSPALAELLRRSTISTIAQRYEAKSAESTAAQNDLRRAALRANWAVLAAAVFNALLLVAGTLRAAMPAGAADGIVVGITVLGALSAALATMFIAMARNSKLLEEWYSRRAEAEASRRDYFERLFTVNTDPNLLLIKLEYFRRYQLDLQTAYFRTRRKEHTRKSRMLSMGSAGAAAAGMLTTAIAGTLSSRYPNMIAIAGLSSIATAAAAFITTRESIFRYQQNAESYRQAQDALDKLSEKIDDVRLAAANGQAEPVLQFIGAVHEQLMLEHQQWLKSSESAQEALQRLQETLDKIRAPQGKAAATTTGTRP